ncbi:hypothetical protein Ahy_B01g053136 [Arachis hypogaea]|uniref:FAR1 domain-containing protein n=1 Tax=Arachis hypogaea TaxID=3818 RepID=A0A445AR55_ARAHY|nr:hypothetical protein Ahy_B01g053136 [Arachis hypogaea]
MGSVDKNSTKNSIQFDDLNFEYSGSSEENDINISQKKGAIDEAMKMVDLGNRFGKVEKKLTELTKDDIWGIEHDSVEQCVQFYKHYAKAHDFVARCDEKGYDFNGNLNMRQMVCNRENTRRNKYLEMENGKRDHRLITSEDIESEKIVGVRYSALAMLCFTLCDKASKHQDDFMEIREDIFGLIMKLHKRHNPNEKMPSTANLVGDPCVVKTKGAPRQTTKAAKARKCSHCKRISHTNTKKDRISNVQKSNKRKRLDNNHMEKSRQPNKKDHKEVSTDIGTYGAISSTKDFVNFQFMN